VKGLFKLAAFYYRLKSGPTLFFIVGLMVLSGVVDTLGIGMLIPLVEGDQPNSKISKALHAAFDFLHIDYSLTSVLLAMVILFFAKSAFSILRDTYVGKVTAWLLVDIRIRMLHRLFKVKYRYYLDQEVGYLTSAMTNQFSGIAGSFTLFATLLNSLVWAAISVAVPFILAPKVTIAVLIIGLPALILIRRLNRLARQYSIRSSLETATLHGLLIQTLQNFKYLKATNSQESIVGKTIRASWELGRLQYLQRVLQALGGYGLQPFVMLMVAAVFFYHVKIVGGQVMEIGVALYFLKRALESILMVQDSYRKVLNATGSIMIYQGLDEDFDRYQEAEAPGRAEPDFDQPLRLEGVDFAYNQGRPVLKDVSLTIPPRQTVAFVGPSGAGKSTLVVLLAGILQPSGGRISLGPDSYDDLDQGLLRRSIGFVTQEGVIFNDTIANNITLWNPASNLEEIERAADKAHIKEFIADLDQGYQTLLGDNGVRVSGGQRQRISIARELYKNTPLLIFDEATSALDTATEKEIQGNIDAFKGEKTIIIIAHRLSTVRNADTIFVLKEGRVVEQGAYDQLVLQDGEFRRMAQEQMAVQQAAEETS